MERKQFILNNIGLILGLLLAGFAIGYAQNVFQAPTVAPPGANTDAPLNVGPSPQIKNGALGVNSLAVFNFLNTLGVYQHRGTSGISKRCQSGQTLNGTEVAGGIVTAGECGAGAGGGAGASTREVVRTTSFGATTIASCPAGKKLTGGGCSISDGASGNVFANCRLVRNGPWTGAPDSSWLCQWKHRDNSGDCGEAGMMNTYAICE